VRRVALVASHPIQYQAPYFRALSEACDLTVWFCHQQTPEEQARAGFGQAFEWDVPLLEGYRYEWLENVSPRPGVGRFGGCDTPELRKKLDAGSFDACIVSGWYLKSYLQAIRAARSLGVRVLVRGDSQLAEGRGLLRRAVKYFPYRLLMRQGDAFLYVGASNYAYLRHYGVPPERLFFSPHFVENERFTLGAATARDNGDAAALRATWGAAAGDVVFAFAGKLIAIKRVEDFVMAIAVAARRDRAIRGVIVGSGPDGPAIRALAARESAPIAFAGFTNQRALPAVYAAADCLVLPSRSESWGLVVNEAMASGIPAIVSDRVGCALDLIEEGKTGFTFPVGDWHALADRLIRVRHQMLAERDVTRQAVLSRISRHSCANAVAGTLRALEAVAEPVVGASPETRRRHA
jgi:glycosyltransferase involved in cell wall biosynthesis